MPPRQGFDALGIAVAENHVFPLQVNALELPVTRQDPQLGLRQQVFRGLRQGSEAVAQLLAEIGQVIETSEPGQPAVELDLDPGTGHVVPGQVGPP